MRDVHLRFSAVSWRPVSYPNTPRGAAAVLTTTNLGLIEDTFYVQTDKIRPKKTPLLGGNEVAVVNWAGTPTV